MRYTWPKFKLCRREQFNLFWSSKYNLKKRRSVPGQHWSNMQRYSEYWKLLRNKQKLKRQYLLTEKQFRKIVKEKSSKFSKNKWVSHDLALFMFLEIRLDTLVYRSGLAQTIMQARQMVNHWHFLLNWRKHNIPSTVIKIWDKIELRWHLHTSPLYSQAWTDSKVQIPTWIKIDKKSFWFELIDLPSYSSWDTNKAGEVLKVIEFYARA